MNSRCLAAVLAVVMAIHSSASASVEVEINGATPNDDYLSWTPVVGRARLVNESANRTVTLKSSAPTAGGDQGEIQFQKHTGVPLTAATFAPTATLTLTLPSSGAWREFWVAGKKASAGNILPGGGSAAGGKDVQLIVADSAGTAVATLPTMVRIRKNAETLTSGEIARFLTAVATLHDVPRIGQTAHDSRYLKYVKAHGDAFFMGIHGVPAFGPWHRTMLLSFERELQAIDPSVSLPYWKFDTAAPKLFTPAYLGRVSGGSPFVVFSPSNPLYGWRMPPDAQIASWAPSSPPPSSTETMVRDRNGSTTPPTTNMVVVLGSPDYSVMYPRLINSYHNSAHNYISGWLANITSPKDPLFFLLHCNVDRGWLEWQKAKNAFDHTNPMHYFPLGPYVPGGLHHGNFANDTQWPWNLAGGPNLPGDTGDDWPAFSFPLPGAYSGHGPSAKPVTREAIDFMNVGGGVAPHCYGYDTIPYSP